MSSSLPANGSLIRRLIILAAALFAVVIGQTQVLLGWGQSPAEFAADSDATLRVAGYAFAIWGVIYLWLLVYAFRQLFTRAGGEAPIRRHLGWPSALAMFGIGTWVVAAAFDQELGTIILIVGSLLILLVPLLANSSAIRALPRGDRERWLTVWPVTLLAGWLTVAAPVNVITVVTGNGDLPTALSPTGWAILAVVAVALIALFVTSRLRTLAYGLPIAWGLTGAFVAEQVRNPLLAQVAIGAAVTVLVGSATLVLLGTGRRK